MTLSSEGVAKLVTRLRLIERESRSASWVEVLVRSDRIAETPSVITNLSTRGCRIRAGVVLNVGELIHIIVPRLGSVAARVNWSQGTDSGAEFVPGSDSWGAAATPSLSAKASEPVKTPDGC